MRCNSQATMPTRKTARASVSHLTSAGVPPRTRPVRSTSQFPQGSTCVLLACIASLTLSHCRSGNQLNCPLPVYTVTREDAISNGPVQYFVTDTAKYGLVVEQGEPIPLGKTLNEWVMLCSGWEEGALYGPGPDEHWFSVDSLSLKWLIPDRFLLCSWQTGPEGSGGYGLLCTMILAEGDQSEWRPVFRAEPENHGYLGPSDVPSKRRTWVEITERGQARYSIVDNYLSAWGNPLVRGAATGSVALEVSTCCYWDYRTRHGQFEFVEGFAELRLMADSFSGRDVSAFLAREQVLDWLEIEYSKERWLKELAALNPGLDASTIAAGPVRLARLGPYSDNSTFCD